MAAAGSTVGSGGTRRTKYEQIAQDLQSRIRSAEFPLDADLPTEAQLREQYGASRFTVREALRHLEQLGMIVRRQGSGSRVLRAQPVSRFTVNVATEADILRYAQDTCLEVTHRAGPIPHLMADLAGLGEDDDWSWLSGVRRVVESQLAIGLSDVYIRSDIIDGLDLGNSAVEGAIFERVAAVHGEVVARIEQTVTAVIISDAAGRELSCPAGHPGLRVLRRYFSDRRLFEVSMTVHPADRFEYSLLFERPRGDERS